MYACFDVDYREDRARAACVVFGGWTDEVELARYSAELDVPAPYTPGALFERELPCLLAVLEAVSERAQLRALVVDGYAWLDSVQTRPGLGAHLWNALECSLPVIGVAKNPFAEAGAAELLRGQSEKPLYVTGAGIATSDAADRIAEMAGEFRIPTLLRLVDQLSRSWAP